MLIASENRRRAMRSLPPHQNGAAIAVPHPHHAATPWHDLKRDWHRWSRGERLVAECFLAAVLFGATLVLATVSLP